MNANQFSTRKPNKEKHHRHVALMLTGLLGLVAGCNHKAELIVTEQSPSNPNAGASVQPSTPATLSTADTEISTELQSAIDAAQAAVQTQNYSNAVQRFDALRSKANLNADQLARIHDAEARLMRGLAARAATGDENALRQFRELADRPRSNR